MFGNPPQILQFPAVAAMWHRQDIREAELVAESLYDNESVFGLDDDRKPVPIAAALIGKVGYRFVRSTASRSSRTSARTGTRRSGSPAPPRASSPGTPRPALSPSTRRERRR